MTPEQENEVISMLEDYKRIGWLWRGISYVAKMIAALGAAAAVVIATYKTMVKP